MKSKILIFLFAFSINYLKAQNKAEEIALNSSNKAELTKILKHFKESKEPLQYKAACYLIENMVSHHTYNFYWADSLNQKIEFDELAYTDLTGSINAFETLKIKHGKVHPVQTVTNDLDEIKADFLIDNIEKAFIVWKRDKYDFNTFCEYILPYRVEIEPLQQWREKYNNQYSQVIDNQLNTSINDKIKSIADYNSKWFLCTYKIEQDRKSTR